ncbi:zinc finger protein VAR3, chloroplastic [Iris pallida]|uniref:Zinc finger protein VAR3, chloroplastic n=1 Tax=Iris pallida TaxID=29817 RepID=A0AAX6I146_IRIPA|nr:zinc finger protein VAR3, chloroplastic [Iris pallida]
MASSRLYNHLTSSFLLLPHRTTTKTLSFLSSSSFRLLRPIRSCSTTASTATAAPPPTPTTTPSLSHPWPEWDQFLDKMRSKGYFQRTTDTGNGVDRGGGGEEAGGFMDQNRIKNACLKFARERFDILRSLPKDEIQTVVESGCPNLLRKAVNSAKRLRAFLKLDEGDVCSVCILRGSCDKAYIIAKEDEGARTVDVMRILMTYAVDPDLQSGVDNPSVKEHVHESARRLLAELTKLSDTTIDPIPDLPPPSVQQSSKKVPSQNSQKATVKSKKSQDVEMKRGDWLCPNCNFLNFARNVRCLECKEDGPKRTNFGGAEMKLGDWTCPQCEFMNFARNKKCFRCQEVRPKRHLNPGEWECPSCDFLNFRGNKLCKKCNHDGPEADMASQFDDHVWRSPRKAKENKAFTFGDDEEDSDDGENGISPLQEGENNFVASKRAKPATSARKQTSPWL